MIMPVSSCCILLPLFLKKEKRKKKEHGRKSCKCYTTNCVLELINFLEILLTTSLLFTNYLLQLNEILIMHTKAGSEPNTLLYKFFKMTSLPYMKQ